MGRLFPVLAHSAAWNRGLLGTISTSAVKIRTTELQDTARIFVL